MKQTVLIVDDSLTVRMDLAQAFEAAGFAAVLCPTAAEARAAMRREVCALVVLDVLLPDGDGIDLLREIRSSASPDVPVMLLSSEAEVKDRIRGLTTGADEYVGKPYDSSYVVSRAHQLVQQSRPAPSTVHDTVLVIDDSATFTQAMRDLLQSRGFKVAIAATGEDGLRMAADLRPLAILVDNKLPGIDGFTVVRRIRLDEALRTTPCLMVTGSGDEGAELRALDVGVDGFLRKEDLDIDVIVARLTASLRGFQQQTKRVLTSSLSGPKKILAVDDSATYLHELSDVLTGDGYDVVAAHSGREALEMLATQAVDCILLDVLMPDMDGKQTCQRIKATPLWRDIPLIMLTALEEREAMIEGLSVGADDYISKSGDFAVLKARVRAQIRRRQFEDENRRMRNELVQKELDAAAARAAQVVAGARALMMKELEHKNSELEAFSYSVSHDLRAPLRVIDGFSQALLEDCSAQLDAKGKEHLGRVRAAVKRMAQLIEDLLELSRIGRAELKTEPVDLSDLVQGVADEVKKREPERRVEIRVQRDVHVMADPRLMRVVFDNLLDNARKFTAKTEAAFIDFGAETKNGAVSCFVRDNGAGFDMTYVDKLFRPFQRLHTETDFKGTGIGLAIVNRIIDRHGGRIWAEGAVGHGATFYFTLPSAGPADRGGQRDE